MTATRPNLKAKFAAGARPTAGDFAALIDAALIMDEEGFRKTDDDGLLVSSATKGDGLLSFRRRGSSEDLEAAWSIGFGGSAGKFVLQRGPFNLDQPPIVTFEAERRDEFGPAPQSGSMTITANVRIGQPEHDEAVRLDVAGITRSDGRLGRQQACPADGQWHDITGELTGCSMFEVVAGVRNTTGGTGRVAVVRAIAMNAFNPTRWADLLFRKKRIRMQHAYYLRHRDRLELKWRTFAEDHDNLNRQHGRDARYTLAIRSRNAYAEGAQISVFVTQLWYDSQVGAATGTAGADSAGSADRLR